MPKAAKSTKARTTKSATSKPYERTQAEKSDNIESRSSSSTSKGKTQVKAKVKDPKQSHLYTDDNPSTTLHGTGFKDAETAHRTISLVSQRSLTYQWQVINTMHYRAKGHPSMKKQDTSGAEGMKAAMSLFRHWLDTTYVDARKARQEEGREFKPLLKKEVVAKYLDRIMAVKSDRQQQQQNNSDDDEEYNDKDLEDCQRFTKLYIDLPKGKRLANILLDNAHPEREDWEIRRETALLKLRNSHVRDSEDESEGQGEDEMGNENGLWNEKGGASEWHLRCIAWAWSPVGERRLPP